MHKAPPPMIHGRAPPAQGSSSEHPGEMKRSEFAICKTEDGKDWVLGEGSFGTVRRSGVLRDGLPACLAVGVCCKSLPVAECKAGLVGGRPPHIDSPM